MYCSTCGTELQAALNYCKSCGTRIDKGANEGNSTVSQYLSVATGFVGLAGLGLTVGLIAILLNNNVVPEAVVVLTALFLAVIFGICFMMIQQISKLTNLSAVFDGKVSERNKPAELDAVVTGQLIEADPPPPRAPAMSVTDTTTRTLDEVFVKRS